MGIWYLVLGARVCIPGTWGVSLPIQVQLVTAIQPPVLQLNLFGRNHNHNHNLPYLTSSSHFNPRTEYYSPLSFPSFSVLPFAKLVSKQVQVKL